MPRSVSVEGFATASAAYAKKAVDKANSNGNTYLTKTEATALPADLRDNFEHVRLSSMNNVATAAGFVREYSKYVADAAKRADVNGNGVIDASEIRKLPTDLQDNFANFAKVPVPSGPPEMGDVALPLSAENISKVRAAFVDYVENTLTVRRPSDFGDGEFEYDNRDWAELIHEYGGDDEHEGLKAEALKMARSWTPNGDWEANSSSGGGVYFTGDFKFITLFVSLEKGKPPSFTSEVD